MIEQQKRQQLYDTMEMHSWIVPLVKIKTDTMISNQSKYEAIAREFINPGLKWWLVAVIHEMEASQNFSKYLGNGQSLQQVTTIVPKGRGPFSSFLEGAIDALKLQGADKIQDWSMGNVLYFLEGFNGYGYEQFHHIHSPYMWAGSNHYTSGKYVADGKYDATAVSKQIGVALMLKNLLP